LQIRIMQVRLLSRTPDAQCITNCYVVLYLCNKCQKLLTNVADVLEYIHVLRNQVVL
jgi:hypothetical protein